MGNLNSSTAGFDLKIAKLSRKIDKAYLRYDKAFTEMNVTIAQLQEQVAKRNQAQDLLSDLLNKIVPTVELARSRIAKLERDRFGDLDEYESGYGSDHDPAPEGAESAEWESGSVFQGALAGVGRPSDGRPSDLPSEASTLLDGEPARQGPGPGLAPRRKKDFGQGWRRRGSLVSFFCIILWYGYCLFFD
ncbi:hypothetical protein C7212DRAFT_345549 [Tuber magnatum]|uniref:Uncharacterized protein n=1 Tax=Tuber magnatum TaxID=42249 RepID=A0A317SQF8_9PEZI|nr:hypothetical protein C7212DRAFT_345549 [Tuber magnatum]